jgi:hypothetical protein
VASAVEGVLLFSGTWIPSVVMNEIRDLQSVVVLEANPWTTDYIFDLRPVLVGVLPGLVLNNDTSS